MSDDRAVTYPRISKPTEVGEPVVELPLNVQVARALGCQPRVVGFTRTWSCTCSPQGFTWPHGNGGRMDLPPYGEDSPAGWACTGPLIQERKFNIFPWGAMYPGRWRAVEAGWAKMPGDGKDHQYMDGNSVCEAAARLIAALVARAEKRY